MSGEFSRREFFKIGATGLLGLYVGSRLDGFVPAAYAAIPGGNLLPGDIPKYQTALLVPPVMPRAGVIPGGKRSAAGDYYEISMKQIKQQILPGPGTPGGSLPETTVWGYGAVAAMTRKGLLIHHAPSLTIEARAGRPTRVKWINDLKDANGNYLPHLLPVDPTLHWANPPQGSDPLYGTGTKDSRPVFTETPGQYTGPVPIVTHVHGAVGVADDSDGYAEAWYLPAAANNPADYATEGTWYDFFAGKAEASYGATWGPGYATFQYPNDNRAATIWYHDHALGMTRLNVYAGPAGFYIIRGGPAGDSAVLDSRFGTPAVLPSPAPRENENPPTKTYYEIPIAIQDRAFNTDGSLFYPDSRSFFDGGEHLGGYIPDTPYSPIWNPEFFGNTIMVNGNTWPFHDVEQRRYRFRFLNGCQSRFLILDFSQIPGVEVWQIGNEGGFLAAPVNLTADNGNQLLMGLAERADLIVDFTNVPRGSHVLGNVGPDEPFGGPPFTPADVDSTGQIMEFRVGPAKGIDTTTPPQFLVLPTIAQLPQPTVTRKLALIEMMDMENPDRGPTEAMLGVVDNDGMPMHQMWSEPVTENPVVGATEDWEMYNFTADAHPMHVHEVTFEVLNRQALVVNEDGETEPPARLDGDPRDPEPWEMGLKDTTIAYPGEVTRIRAQFSKAGQYVWHCHIVEHEDNEMMRPYRIGPVQPGQPGTVEEPPMP